MNTFMIAAIQEDLILHYCNIWKFQSFYVVQRYMILKHILNISHDYIFKSILVN